MDIIWSNIRYSVRMLAKKPGLTLAAIIAIALGVGANTTIFSVVNTVLLQPLPFEQPENLLMLSTETRGVAQTGPGSFSIPDFTDIQTRASTLQHVATYQRSGTVITEGGEPERVIGASVTADYFPLLRVKPILGRVFTREDDKEGAASVIVLSHHLWQKRYGGDPSIIGREINLGGKTTVIGVMPAGFQFPISNEKQDYWEAMLSEPRLTKADREGRGTRSLGVIARLKEGHTLAQARSELYTIAQQIEEQAPDSNTNVVFNALPLHEVLTGDYRPALLVMLAAVGLVLLIACANVANLLLTRAMARQREIALRTALGASRSRIMGQLLTESVILSVLGGTLALLLAAWGLQFLIAYGPAEVPRLQQVQLDKYVLGFTFGISLITGVIFGLIPAWHASRPDPGSALKAGGPRSSEGGHNRMRSSLIIAEVALSLMLLVGAGLLIRTFTRLVNSNAGFATKGVLSLDLPLSRSKYQTPEQQSAAFQQLVQIVRSVPGVTEASVVSNLPLSGNEVENTFQIAGRTPFAPGEVPSAEYTIAGPDYFRTLNIPLLAGRTFTEHDTATSPRVMVVSDTFARQTFPGEDPLGKRIIVEGEENDQPPAEIIGIVGDVRRNGFDIEAEPEFYLSHLQNPERRLNLVMRSDTLDSAQYAQSARDAVRAWDANQLIWRTQTLDELVERSLASRRFNMMLLGIFAAVALLLAAVGLYGVMSYSVSWRTQEIGIRMALGAQRSDVLKMIVGQGMLMTMIGVVIGLGSALALSRVLASLLYGVSPRDLLTFSAVSGILTIVALIACIIPARRAMKVDPIVALRAE
ncbi:MAG TPA: ABC transporter permease [Pyrinomonadaceae bacterium]|nr:ABC transporter permease [Pyrinomonadaceae bacterium]